ncbi:thioesterase family protein [Salinarimonas sp.]|uniref:acyl-CoA thioesterase n=1 Tax=Salinarimonas sp. TaxID=2766526 RepID=UPI0032D96A50
MELVSRPPPKRGFHHDLHVRYNETDQMGIVYHANYIIWFNEARDRFMGSLGISIPELERTGLTFPVTEVTCRYLAPARYGDVVRVWVEPVFSPVARLEIRYRVTKPKSSQLLCTGTTVNVILDANGKMLIKLPAIMQRFADRFEAVKHAQAQRD